MFLHLTNSTDKKVFVCKRGLSFLRHKKIDQNWRLHSAGYAVLQFMQEHKIQTMYLHKILATEFIPKPESDKKLFVRVINGDKLDCRIENLEWTTMAILRRHQNKNSTYRGVSKDGKKYRAILYDGGQRIYLGVFNTPEEAAKAYNEESLRRFGNTESLNNVS